MNTRYNLSYRAFLTLGIVLALTTSCGEDFFDINTDPNNPSEAELSLILPAVQVGYVSATLREVNRATAAFVDQVHDFDYGRFQQQASDFNNDWKGYYNQSLRDIEEILAATAENIEIGNKGYAGIAKLQKAYIYLLLVDLWGDVPFSEAFVNDNPQYDTGAAIYAQLYALIDEGIADLRGENGAVGSVPANADMIYRGDLSQWIKMGNSLKLKMYNQTRLIDPTEAQSNVAAILSDGEYIDATEDDFQLPFGSGFAPQNAHPRWIDDYIESGRSGYFANHFFVKMMGGVDPSGDTPRGNHYELLSDNVQYGMEDPRLRYYFRRQLTYERPGDSNVPCLFNSVDCNYFYPGRGYLGRDRGDNSVGPADILVATKWGVYPAGGVFDNLIMDGTNRNESPVGRNDGTGEGIFPMLTNFMMKFIRAEAALTLNTGEDPRLLLEEGMRASISKVQAFGAAKSNVAENVVSLITPTNSYVAAVMAKYDAADEAGKLEIIIDQAYVANFGNGIESYNNYRRTGYPVLQDVVDNNAVGPFPLRLAYVVDEIGANANVPQTDNTNLPVFWDIE